MHLRLRTARYKKEKEKQILTHFAVAMHNCLKEAIPSISIYRTVSMHYCCCKLTMLDFPFFGSKVLRICKQNLKIKLILSKKKQY